MYSKKLAAEVIGNFDELAKKIDDLELVEFFKEHFEFVKAKKNESGYNLELVFNVLKMGGLFTKHDFAAFEAAYDNADNLQKSNKRKEKYREKLAKGKITKKECLKEMEKRAEEKGTLVAALEMIKETHEVKAAQVSPLVNNNQSETKKAETPPPIVNPAVETSKQNAPDLPSNAQKKNAPQEVVAVLDPFLKIKKLCEPLSALRNDRWTLLAEGLNAIPKEKIEKIIQNLELARRPAAVFEQNLWGILDDLNSPTLDNDDVAFYFLGAFLAERMPYDRYKKVCRTPLLKDLFNKSAEPKKWNASPLIDFNKLHFSSPAV